MKKTLVSRSLSVLLVTTALASTLQASSFLQFTPEGIYPELRRVLKQAEEHSHNMYKMDLNLASSQMSMDIALSDRFPHVNLGTGAGAYWSSYKDRDGNRRGIEAGINQLTLSASYSLYSWGAKQAGHRMARNSYEQFLINYENQMASFGRDIRNRFLQLILDKFSLRTLELEVAINQANIEQDTLRFEQGRLSAENYERAMNSRRMRQINLENLRRNVERSIEDFNRVIGIDAITLEDIPTTIPRMENLNQQLTAVARQIESMQFQDIPSVRQAQLRIDNAEDGIISTRSRMRPNLSLSSRLSLDIEPTSDNQRVWRSSTGIGVSWNIYSGGANTNRLLQAYNNRLAHLADYRDLLARTKIDLDRLVENLSLEYSRLEIAESEYQLELQAYEKSKEEYERGRISELHFLNIELQRLNQERSIYNNRRQYMNAVANFLSTIGKDPVLDIFTAPEAKNLTAIFEQY